jgi:hypothetical protein
MLLFDSVQRHLKAPPAAAVERIVVSGVDANVRETLAALAQRGP